MSTKSYSEKLDRLVEQERARFEALEALRSIAHRFPDLAKRFAECLRDDGELRPTAEADRKPLNPKEVEPGDKLSPTLAVTLWLKQYGQGTAAEIVNAVLDHIETTSGRPANIVYSTLSSLESRGRVASHVNENGDKVYALTRP